MADSKPAKTPLPDGTVLTNPQRGPDKELPYRELIGVLMHLSNTVHPDITYSVNLLSRFMNCYSYDHWNAAKHVLQYLKGSPEFGLVFGSEEEASKFEGYADADFAGDRADRKSTSGYLFVYNGALISWRSKKQSMVAQSTQESEYISLSWAAREAVWIKNLARDMGEHTPGPITIKCDNQAAIRLSKSEIVNERTKHIDVKMHFVRDLVRKRMVDVVYCPSDKMLADLLTKVLGAQAHCRMCSQIGMQM